MADWEEVRQLAADFQKLQESKSTLKLSERNCIEVVTRLINTGQVEVVYTLDGKEYVTIQQLEREIKNELIAQRGRINITDLQTIMNVDLSHVEIAVTEILKHDHSTILLHGELISKMYIDALCEEINDNLQESGQMLVADISKSFALPNSFLLEIIEDALGGKIHGELDKSESGIIYTEAYVCRYRSRIRGLFSAITHPTSIGPIIIQRGFQEKLFLSMLHNLLSSGQLLGSLHGHGDKALYTPKVYTRMQNKWADSFLASNGYLEYDTLRRLGMNDPQGYVLRRYCDPSNECSVMQLASCAIGEGILKELEGAVDDIATSEVGGWIDVLPLLPAPCTSEDAQLLLQKKYSSDDNLKIFGSYVTTSKLIQSCYDFFTPLIKDKAEEIASLKSGLLSEIYQRELEVGAASSRTAHGKGKRKQRIKGKRNDDVQKVEDRNYELQFMTTSQIAAKLSENLVECDELSEYIAENIESLLQSALMKEAMTLLSSGSMSQGQASSRELRKRHATVQEKIQSLWNTTSLYDKAIGHFEGNAAIQLSKYLLRTLCSDLLNVIIMYLAEDCGLVTDSDTLELNVKKRSEIIAKFPDHMKKTISLVNVSLNGKEVGVFFGAYENLCSEHYCGFMLKRLDKKKERLMVFSHQQSLIKSLQDEQDCAMALHVIVVLLFQQGTGSIIHIPGKFIPTLISFLAQLIPKKEHEKLVQCQQLISSQWKSKHSVSISSEESNKEELSTAVNTMKQDNDAEAEGSIDTASVSEVYDVDPATYELIRDLKQLVVKART